MRNPQLDQRQRLEAAKLSGTVERIVGAGGERLLADVVAEVHAASQDPIVLGDVLGAYIVRAEGLPHFAPILEVLRAAGADEDRAAQAAAWQRRRIAHAAQAAGRPIL